MVSDDDLKDFYEREKRRRAKKEFLDNFLVQEKACPYICPYCTQGYNIGKLHESTVEPGVFTCRNCRKSFKIECQDITNTELFELVYAERQARRDRKKLESGK